VNLTPAILLTGLLALPAAKPSLRLRDGVRRAFGDRKITRTFTVEGEGTFQVHWRARVFRGVVGKGSSKVTAPGDFAVELSLPDVRARVDLVLEVQLKDDTGRVATGGRFPLALFPNDIIAEYAESHASLPPIGLLDPDGLIAPVLKDARLPFTLLEGGMQIQTMADGLILVAPDQAAVPGDVIPALVDRLQQPGSVIVLDHAGFVCDLLSGEVTDDAPQARAASAARPLVGGKHLLLQDLMPGDLQNWAGSGPVSRFVLGWPEEGHFRPLAVTDGGDESLPLILERWRGESRIIFCQLDVARHLRDEPAAQIILRNLIACARETPIPRVPRRAVVAAPTGAVAGGRFAPDRFIANPDDDARVDAACLITFLLPPAPQTPIVPTYDPARFLRQGGRLIVESRFEPPVVRAVNRLLNAAWRDDPRDPLPRITTAEAQADALLRVDYTRPICWGVLRQDIVSAVREAGSINSLRSETHAKGLGELIAPGILVKYERDGAQLLLLSLPPQAADNAPRERLAKQLACNAASPRNSNSATFGNP